MILDCTHTIPQGHEACYSCMTQDRDRLMADVVDADNRLDTFQQENERLELELKEARSDSSLDNTSRKIVEQENSRLEKIAADQSRNAYDVEQELKRLREALEFYANYDIYGTEMRRAGGILVDGGDTAREALAADREKDDE